MENPYITTKVTRTVTTYTTASSTPLSAIIAQILTVTKASKQDILEMENQLNQALGNYKGERRRESIL